MMKNKYKVIADPEYGYLRLDPVPSQDEVERYYEEEFYSSEYKRFNDSSIKVQQEEEDFFNSRWESICRVCSRHFGHVKGLSVFDIGFGFAQALLYFRGKGMIASGLEPSPEGVEYARSQGLDVFQAGIESFTCVGSRRFDVVTLINVLEHLRDPAETLMNIRTQLIKPGGLLVIDVPNEFNDFQTIADAEYSLGQWWVFPPSHINYFSTSSLKRLLNPCGYNVQHCESSFPLEIFLLMGDIYVGNSELGKLCHQKRVKFEYVMRKYGKSEKLARLYQALAELDLGRQAVVFAVPR
jgi:2-polyprenyl-3-methyl-5-hydroxy-6-metoxy-1,4-benzoquinol methylase